MYFRLLFLAIILALSVNQSLSGAEKPFTVVIDPGHGGRDPGAVGATAYEKNIVLSVALKLGKLIEANNKDVNLVYTRNTDVFVKLEDRAVIANKAKADLFISIHTDGVNNKKVTGASVFTLGQDKLKENIEVAKRENSVILLEENYEQRYEGFNPSSAESYIMFEFLQDAHLDQSIAFASLVQNGFVHKKRADRGVRQAPYWVLFRTSMPSVLVELGFITNPDEERYLKSEKGQNELAHCIYDAVVKFKNDYERKSMAKAADQNTGTSPVLAQGAPVYKIQLFATRKLMDKNDKEFRGLKNIDYYQEKRLYKYTYGAFPTEKEAAAERKKIASLFPDAFVIAFKDDSRISLEEARSKP
ncbi:MAG: N-acetylmuramoyl-L-alanine amidase [Bacteroidales bacterium]|nr:N-acetylmuramoyl-L-alanine amidase [Bacteroidales bacterium]MDD2618002.1 N-acetylmuramoyl-L-alanine amidase [Bacteroidales bacterium]MDD4640735.1 N-acetylmuramoyl-L-alanine amidase [Bacteroidales bacterium]